MQPLLLASGSPQRTAILDQLGVSHRIAVPDVQELETGVPRAIAAANARLKADAAAASLAADDEWILAVDTIVVIDGVIHGKPDSEADARAVLLALRGSRHEVLGGLCLLEPVRDEGRIRHELVACTGVTFRSFDEGYLDRYLRTGEWRGRAGGYAIQGAGTGLVAAIDGCYENVVGLPVAALYDLIDSRGLPPLT